MMYHLLQQFRLILTQDDASGLTPSLAALNDATSLRQRDWLRRKPGEDTPRQYSSIGGHLTPHTPGNDDMRLDPSLNITPEGSLIDIPTVVKKETPEQISEREIMGTSSETAYMELPSTQVKTVPKKTIPGVSKPIRGTKEASRAEVLVTTRQFFAAVDQRNRKVPTENLVTPAEAREGENIEAPNVSTSTVTTAITSITTPPMPLEVEIRGTSSPRISLPEGSPSCPTVTATCRPRTWMQQLTEGQINEP